MNTYLVCALNWEQQKKIMSKHARLAYAHQHIFSNFKKSSQETSDVIFYRFIGNYRSIQRHCHHYTNIQSEVNSFIAAAVVVITIFTVRDVWIIV